MLTNSVLWHCWLGGRKGIWPVKYWVVGCWHGYLSGARCRLASADANATHCLLLQKIQIGFTFLVPAHPGSPRKRVVKRVYVCVCVITWNTSVETLINLGFWISSRVVSETHPHAMPRPRSDVVSYSREYGRKSVHCTWWWQLCGQCDAGPNRLLLKHLQTNTIPVHKHDKIHRNKWGTHQILSNYLTSGQFPDIFKTGVKFPNIFQLF